MFFHIKPVTKLFRKILIEEILYAKKFPLKSSFISLVNNILKYNKLKLIERIV